MIEKVAVVVKAHATVKEVAAAGNPLGINIANRADHQVERQPKLAQYSATIQNTDDRTSSISSPLSSIP